MYYSLGIIDFAQSYDYQRKMQHSIQTLLSKEEISCVSP